MSKDLEINRLAAIKTPGFASCGEGEGSPSRLFRVMTGVPVDYALEQASVLMTCVHTLTFEGVMEKNDTLVWAAHMLSGLARALVDDVGQGISHSILGCVGTIESSTRCLAARAPWILLEGDLGAPAPSSFRLLKRYAY